MANKAFLELEARVDGLLRELAKAQGRLEEFEKAADKDLTLDVDIDKAYKKLTEVKDRLVELGTVGKVSKAELNSLVKQVEKLAPTIGEAAAALDDLGDSDELNPLVLATNKLRKELDSLVVGLNNAESASDFTTLRENIRNLQERFKQLGVDVELNGDDVKGLATKYNSLGNAIRGSLSLASTELKKLKETGDDAATSLINKLGELERVLLELRAAEDKSNQGLLDSRTAYSEIRRQLSSVAPLIANLGKEMPEVVSRFNSLSSGVGSSLSRVNRELKTLEQEANKHGKATAAAIAEMAAKIKSELNPVAPSVEKTSNSFKSLTSGVGQVNTAIRLVIFSRIVQELKQLAEASVETAVELQALRNSFAAVLADSDGMEQGFSRADEAMSHIRDTADDLGVAFLPLAENFLTLQAAGDAAGLSAKEVGTIFDAVAVAAAGMNLSTDKLSKALAAFEQIMSKSVVSAEEVRRQLGNSIPGAFSIFARAAGVGNAEFEKMLRSGSILSTEILPSVAKEMLKTFGPAAIANANSARAEFARMNNDLISIKNVIGDALLPALVDLAREFRKTFKDIGADDIERFSHAIEGLSTGVVSLSRVVDLTNKGPLNQLQGLLDLVGNSTKILSFAVQTLGSKALSAALDMKVLTVGFQLLFDKLDKLTGGEVRRQVYKFFDDVADKANLIAEAFKIKLIPGYQDAEAAATEFADNSKKAIGDMESAVDEFLEKNAQLTQVEQATKGLPQHYANIAKEIEGISDDIDKYTREQKELNQEIDPAFLTAYAIRLVEVENRLKDVGALTPQMAAFLARVREGFDEATLSAARTSVELKKLGLSTVGSLEDSSGALLRYIAEVRRAGPATKEQADLIVKSAKDILQALNLLPESQQKQFGALEGVLKRVIGAYQGFTTEAIKEADRLRVETAKKFEDLGKSIEDIFNKLKEKISGSTADDKNAEDIKALSDELGTLQQKAFQSQEDLQRIAELTSEIQNKSAGLSALSPGGGNFRAAAEGAGLLRQSFSGLGAEISKEFTEAILSNDKFIEGLAALPQSSQAAATSLIQNFASIAQSGKATETELTQFFQGIVAIFESAGVKLQGFNEILKGTGDIASQIQSKINDATANARGQLDQKSKEVRDGIQDSASGASANFGANISVDAPAIDNKEILKNKKYVEQLQERYGQLSLRLQTAHETGEDASIIWAEMDKISANLGDNIYGVTQQIEPLAPAFVAAAEATNKARLAADPTNKSYQQLAATGLDLSRAWGRLTQETKDLDNANASWNEQLDNGNIEIAKNEEAIAANTAAMAKNKKAIDNLATGQDDFNASVLATYNATKDLTIAQDQSAASTEEFSAILEKGGEEGSKQYTNLAESAASLEETLKRIAPLQEEINRLMKEMGT